MGISKIVSAQLEHHIVAGGLVIRRGTRNPQLSEEDLEYMRDSVTMVKSVL